MHLLEIQGLQKYFGGLAVTGNVDFYINEGKMVGLFGPNRAGKTTLFNKRLEIARALATGPKPLLLDEVMAGLNPSETDQAIDLGQRIREQQITGKTIN